ncbi:MAG: RimK/LysX family protein [Cyclobacteriaceae bacterium]
MKILGRSDRVDLPGLGLVDIHAKIDTGAYTSSLHCSSAKVVDGRLEFVLLDEEHPEFTGMKFTFDEFDQREIKSSSGEAELRYVIKTTVRIHGKTYKTQFSLSDRDNMKFPILLGRRVLKRRFLIDVAQTDVSFNEKAAQKSKED